MDVRTILNKKGAEVTTADCGVSLRDIARTLRDEKIGAIVLLEDGAPAGIISERDVVRALAESGGEAADKPARDYMTRKMHTCAPEDTTDALMAIMTREHVRHVPVLEEGRLAGIISIGDVVKHRIDEILFEAEQMKRYIVS